MEAFTVLEGVAAPLLRPNINTDIVIRIERLRDLDRDKLGSYAFESWRYRRDGTEDPVFILNKPAYRDARILLAGDNFACGSSREAAVWALKSFGIRCVIAPSFGDIFAQNCTMNGLLVVSLTEAQIEELLASPEIVGAKPIRIDLEAQRIMCGDASYAFDIDPLRKTKLLNGWDDIDITLTHAADIARFVAADARERPWALPHRPQGAA